MDSWLIRSNVAVKMFAEGGKPENPEKNIRVRLRSTIGFSLHEARIETGCTSKAKISRKRCVIL